MLIVVSLVSLRCTFASTVWRLLYLLCRHVSPVLAMCARNLYSDRRLVESVNQRQIDGNTPRRLCAFFSISVLVDGETQSFHSISSLGIDCTVYISDLLVRLVVIPSVSSPPFFLTQVPAITAAMFQPHSSFHSQRPPLLLPLNPICFGSVAIDMENMNVFFRILLV